MSWPLVAIEDLIEVLRNGASIKQNDSAAGTPITRIETIANWEINSKKFGYADVSANEYSNHLLEFGDILISHINSEKHLGKSAIVQTELGSVIHGMNLLLMRVDKRRAFPKYIYQALCSADFRKQLPKITKNSVNQSSFTTSAFKQLKIPLPPLEEQKRIAAILDKADAIRRKREKAIELTNTLLSSVFLDMFGDPVTNPKGWVSGVLENYTNPNDRINYGVVQPGKDFIGGIPLIRSGDIGKFCINLDNLKQIDPQIENSYKRSRIVGDEILISCVGTIGQVALADESQSGYNIARQVIRVRCNEKLNRVFAAHMIASPMIQNYFHKETRTVAQPTLNVLQVKKTPILIPPMELQIKFLKAITQITEVQSQSKTALDTNGVFFKALTQRAFRGELTPSDLDSLEVA